MSDVLYMSIVKDIKKRITDGELSPNDMLNPESELVKRYNVSRMTLRKSLSLLSNEGYIYSVPGKGNFIRKPDTDLYQFRFNEYDSLIDIEDVKLLSVKVEFPTEQILKDLYVKKNEKVVTILKLISSSEGPIALETIYTRHIPQQPVVEDKIHFANYVKALEMKLAFGIKKEIEIRVVKAAQDICMKLGMPKDCDLIRINNRITKKESGQILTSSVLYIKKEHFELFASTPEEDYSRKIF